MPKLHTLLLLGYIDKLLTYMSYSWTLPSLTWANIDSWGDDLADLATYERFFDVHGGSLVHLDIQLLAPSISDISSIIDFCPNVKHLLLSASTSFRSIRTRPTTTHISLSASWEEVLLASLGFDVLRARLSDILRVFKFAKRVMLLNLAPAKFRELKWERWRVSGWRETLREFENVGVEFVFETGERIEVPDFIVDE
jgi:hypothetical protein